MSNLDQKRINCLKRILSLVEKYNLTSIEKQTDELLQIVRKPEEESELLDIESFMKTYVQAYVDDKKERSNLFDVYLPLIFMQSPTAVQLAQKLKDFFEMDEAERIEFCNDLALRCKVYSKALLMFGDIIEDKKQDIAEDLRAFGAYATMFF